MDEGHNLPGIKAAVSQATNVTEQGLHSFMATATVASDLAGAVSHGTVSSPSEYAEQNEFAATVAAKLATLPPKPERQRLVTEAARLQRAIARQGRRRTGRRYRARPGGRATCGLPGAACRWRPTSFRTSHFVRHQFRQRPVGDTLARGFRQPLGTVVLGAALAGCASASADICVVL